MTYFGFLLNAMGTDYYPRLAEVIHDRQAANQLMNDQAQLGLAIGGPMLLIMIGWAPWLIALLYSNDFEPAITLLQWQAVGNVFKLASWALSFSIVAAGLGKTMVLMEISFNVVFMLLIWWFLPTVGLEIVGVAFLIGYIVYFATVYFTVRHFRGFRWQPLSLKLFGLQVFLAFGLLALALVAPTAGFIISPFISVATVMVGLRIVLEKIGPEGRFAGKLYAIYARLGWPIRCGE
jgi:PST family polysaccharide transporter